MLKRRWILPMACAAALLLAFSAPAVRAADAGRGSGTPSAADNASANEPHEAGQGSTAHTEGEHHELLPDLGASQTWYSALWVVIIFCVLLAVLYKTAWKNVLAGLKAREQRIRTDIAEAEAARTKAEATLRDYNAQLAAAEARVREMISSATTEGERIAAQIKTQAQQEAEATKVRAVADIEAARRQALQDIYAQAAELSTRIAEKILRRNLNADDQRDLVNQSLEQLQTVGR